MSMKKRITQCKATSYLGIGCSSHLTKSKDQWIIYVDVVLTYGVVNEH